MRDLCKIHIVLLHFCKTKAPFRRLTFYEPNLILMLVDPNWERFRFDSDAEIKKSDIRKIPRQVYQLGSASGKFHVSIKAVSKSKFPVELGGKNSCRSKFK